MIKFLGVLAAAGMMMVGSNVASAQGLNVRIGVGDPGPRVVARERYQRPVVRRVVERRVVRPAPTRTVCRTVMQETVRRNGVVVRRPTEVCRRTVASRRVYID